MNKRSIKGTGFAPASPLAVVAVFLIIITELTTTVHSTLAQEKSVFLESRPVLSAQPLETSISIDGRLDETAWNQAEIVSDFLQSEPDEGAPATQRTEVRVLYGANDVYLGALLHEDDISRIQSTLGRRDQLNRADWFIVSIDSYFDRKTAYVFAVNAAGVQYDAIRAGGGPGGGLDESWNAIWGSSAQVTSEGWVAEIRIPYSMLRFAGAETQTWGIHFERRIPERGEQSQWPLVRRTERSNRVAQYGLLQGISGVKPRRNIQVQPYTVSRLESEENPDFPGNGLRNTAGDFGGDLKIGLGSNVTLDATINPDFGQVDADPAELNLTAFETFFEERRPFFVEGVQIYDFSLGRGRDLLYTRRIGAEAPIIGAAKLSGRTASGLSFGVFGAATGNNFDPERLFGVARLSRQIHSYSSFGGIITGFDSPEEEGGRLRSLTGGSDWDFRFRNNTYSLRGYATFSHRKQTLGDLNETGLAASLRAARQRGVLKYDFTATLFDDKFNPNEIGRLRRNNFISFEADLDYEVNRGQSFGPFQRGSLSIDTGQQWSYQDRLNLGAEFGLRSRWTLRSFQRIELDASVENVFGGYDLFETRGLSPRAQPTAFEVSGEFQTDDRRSWQIEPGVNVTFQEDGGREYALDLRTNWNVGSRLSLTGDIGAEWENNVIAWSSNESFARAQDGWLIGLSGDSPDELEAGDYAPFDDQGDLDALLARMEPFDDEGRYYTPIFGTRDTRSMDFTLRSSITFTRKLSVQVYGQLFVARGRYNDFQILQDRDTLVPFDAFPKRDDFSFSSFQTNTVLRWEYRPGSTLFLVWTQGRRAEDELNPLAPWGASPYDTPLDTQIGDAFDVFPNNVFLLKLDYTFIR
mgnify:CR=1 FL=1